MSRGWRAELDRRLAGLGLSQARWLVLLHLARFEQAPTQRELAQSVGVEGPTLARLLDSLESQGLVQRQAVVEDRRAKKIVLCAPARPLIEQIETIATQLRHELFEGVDEADVKSRLLVVRYGARLLLASAAVTYSAWVPALGLGEITLHSALNQPLRADIALLDAAGLEEGELSVRLATADEFSRAGVERVFFLNDLKFTPILRGDRSLIRVSSSKPVKEPYLDFLVQLDQPNGRLLREYTVLIDPPGGADIASTGDEPSLDRPASAFPSVQPALSASVLHNQQLQTTLDELNAKLQAQDEQLAVEKRQVSELQARLAQPLPTDEFQLNLDDLSMDTNWDLGPTENTHPSEAPALPELEIEWTIEPAFPDDKL
eukprot:gene3392-3319_t